MGFSPLADMSRRIPDGGRSWSRAGTKITGVGIHHQAGVNRHSEAWNPAREVSANYWITDDGVIIPNIDEDRRAFTSGHRYYPRGQQADMRNITIEVSNSASGGNWPISDAAMSALILLVADIYRRHGLGTVARGANRGVGIHKDWVATECPGPYMVGQLPTVISEANRINSGSGSGSTGGLTVSEADRIIKELKAHISKGNEITRGPSHLGRISKILGGTIKGESIHSKLNRVLGGISGLDTEVSVDPKVLAAAVAEELAPKLTKIDAEAFVTELGKQLSEK